MLVAEILDIVGMNLEGSVVDDNVDAAELCDRLFHGRLAKGAILDIAANDEAVPASFLTAVLVSSASRFSSRWTISTSAPSRAKRIATERANSRIAAGNQHLVLQLTRTAVKRCVAHGSER